MKYLWEISSVEITCKHKFDKVHLYGTTSPDLASPIFLNRLRFNIELNFFFRTIKHYDFKMGKY